MTSSSDQGSFSEVPSRTFLQEITQRFRRNKLASIGFIFLLLIYLVAIFAPVVATHDFGRTDTTNRFLGPSREHWLGTDHLGRDVFSRIVWGARVSLSVGFMAALVSVTLGTTIGLTAGFYGGRVDNVLMRFTEIVLSFPMFFLLLTLVAFLPRSLFTIMFIIGVTSWPSLARIVRGQTLSVKQIEFTEASRAAGANNLRIMFRHILPNIMSPIIVNATLRIGAAIIAETSLSYLGLGVPPPYPTWGAILSDGRGFMMNAPWLTLFPGICIFLVVLSFNYVGDGLRDALDPRSKI